MDIVAYAYLKEELVNTSKSHEVAHLTKNYKNLVKFVQFIEAYLAHIKTNGLKSSQKIDSNEGLKWNLSEDVANRIVSSL